jgi:hypothetical protein
MSSIVKSLASILSLTEDQVNLVIISMSSTLLQLAIYIHILRKSQWTATTLLYLTIVFLYNVMFYKIFLG